MEQIKKYDYVDVVEDGKIVDRSIVMDMVLGGYVLTSKKKGTRFVHESKVRKA